MTRSNVDWDYHCCWRSQGDCVGKTSKYHNRSPTNKCSHQYTGTSCGRQWQRHLLPCAWDTNAAHLSGVLWMQRSGKLHISCLSFFLGGGQFLERWLRWGKVFLVKAEMRQIFWNLFLYEVRPEKIFKISGPWSAQPMAVPIVLNPLLNFWTLPVLIVQ